MYAPPTIVSFSPASGPAGTVVTIKGANLDGAGRVSFHGATGTVSKDTPTTIDVTVPAGATTGKIVVATHGGSAKTVTVFKFT
jgi:ribosomal protein L21E